LRNDRWHKVRKVFANESHQAFQDCCCLLFSFAAVVGQASCQSSAFDAAVAATDAALFADLPPGVNGKKGPKGDSCKSELQVHLNALKSYVDMKFDVLKGMMDKTMTRAASGGVVEESDDSKMELSKMQKQLTATMEDLSETSKA